MALITTHRNQVAAGYMRGNLFPPSVLKADLQAAVAGLDGGLDTVATSLNNSLPLPYRTAATQADKALLLALVGLRRSVADGTYTYEQVRSAILEVLNVSEA